MKLNYTWFWRRLPLILIFITSTLSADCQTDEFQCACGEPQCVPEKFVSDKIPHCQDASDETEFFGSDVIACADGHASRKDPNYRGQTFPFCEHPNPCLPELGQVCLVIHGTWRCVCKLGMIRPPGPAIRCIPVEALPNSLAQGATTNCSELVEDLNLLYNRHFGRHLRIETIRQSDVRVKDEPSSNISQLLHDDLPQSIGNNPEIYKAFDKPNTSCDINDTNACKSINGRCVSKDEVSTICECEPGSVMVADKCHQLVDECSNHMLNDCDKNAVCMDNDLSYECLCREGYIDQSESPTVKPGMKCKKLINECRSPLQNDCSPNAFCIDKPIGFTCSCNNGFVDVSDQGAKRPGRKCRKLIDECASGAAKCDPKAICTDADHGYRCRCPSGYLDVSPEPVNESGRICAQLITDCDPSACSQNAHCVETISGSICQCKSGYTDKDTSHPGHQCIKGSFF